MLWNQGTPENVRLEGEKELGEWSGQIMRANAGALGCGVLQTVTACQRIGVSISILFLQVWSRDFSMHSYWMKGGQKTSISDR